jgi:hypothetical protein
VHQFEIAVDALDLEEAGAQAIMAQRRRCLQPTATKNCIDDCPLLHLQQVCSKISPSG